MAKFPFIGPSYVHRSVNFDAQRSINLYPVKSEIETSKDIAALVGTPGLREFCDIPVNKVRGGHRVGERVFFAVSNKIYELFADGTYSLRGTINTTAGLVSMADNGLELCAVDGPDGWILTLADNSFNQIVSAGWLGADMVAFVDGYFVFNAPQTGKYYISELYSGGQEDPLDFATAEGSPDVIVGLIALRKEVWLFGTDSVEVVFNSGGADFPFQRIQGAFIEYGCVSKGTIAKTANTVFWVGRDAQGQGVVWMANGYQPQRVSTHAVEYAIQRYLNITDASAYTYQEDGHYFYVLNFASANTSWVYDITLNQWHERAYFNLETGEYERHRGAVHVFAFGKHLIGDYATGKIYWQSLDFYDDDGTPIRRSRTCSHMSNNSLDYIYYQRMQVDMETGIGLNDGATEDVIPNCMLRWSDDGGHTWSNEHWREAGRIGKYKWRVFWNRLGRSRDRIFEFTTSVRCKIFLIGGNVMAEKGEN